MFERLGTGVCLSKVFPDSVVFERFPVFSMVLTPWSRRRCRSNYSLLLP
jgi:hypothetical protein